MATGRSATVQDRLSKVSEAMTVARKMQQEWLVHGLDLVDFYIEDWSGNWLENWEDDDELGVAGLIRGFLDSEDEVALQICQNLETCEHLSALSQDSISKQSLAVHLADCLSLPLDHEQQLFAVKTVLADVLMPSTGKGSHSSQTQEANLLNLASALLQKLENLKQE